MLLGGRNDGRSGERLSIKVSLREEQRGDYGARLISQPLRGVTSSARGNALSPLRATKSPDFLTADLAERRGPSIFSSTTSAVRVGRTVPRSFLR